MHVNRSPRTFAATVLAAVLVPFSLSGCATSSETAGPAAQLQAAQDSNLLAVPSEQVYELSEFTITAPTALARLSKVSHAQLDYSGTLVISDDIITDAEFDFAVTGLQDASFVLTEPTTLRRAEDDTGPAYAVGELTVGDQLPMPTTVKFTPTTYSEDELAFDIHIDVPNELPFESRSPAVEDLTAHISLAPIA